jgi:hypothetical protein
VNISQFLAMFAEPLIVAIQKLFSAKCSKTMVKSDRVLLFLILLFYLGLIIFRFQHFYRGSRALSEDHSNNKVSVMLYLTKDISEFDFSASFLAICANSTNYDIAGISSTMR